MPIVTDAIPAELRVFLEPDVHIESDDPEIVALAEELTREAATAWDATEIIVDWCAKNIKYVIADTPSAKLALTKKEGDCGPHATLTIALLRAAGIPARMVGGLLYDFSIDGFGQHVWVEVYIGDGQWVPVDPTTGETKVMSALHIKCFEGFGGVIPERST